MVTHALPCLCGAHSPTVQSHGPCELLGTALWPVSPKRSGLPTVRNIAPPDPCGQDSPFPSLAPNPSEHLAMLSNEHLGGGVGYHLQSAHDSLCQGRAQDLCLVAQV